VRHFWNAAAALDPDAAALDEGRRFPLCNPGSLSDLFIAAGLSGVEVRSIDIWTVFKDFDDFWSPFLGGQGPAPSYVASLNPERLVVRERIRQALPSSRRFDPHDANVPGSAAALGSNFRPRLCKYKTNLRDSCENQLQVQNSQAIIRSR
jgi:hypothetical protein